MITVEENGIGGFGSHGEHQRSMCWTHGITWQTVKRLSRPLGTLWVCCTNSRALYLHAAAWNRLVLQTLL